MINFGDAVTVLTLEVPQLLRPPTCDLPPGAPLVLKGPILAIFPRSCPPTAANVVLQALLFILVEPPFCGFPGLFGVVLSQDGQTRGGSSLEQCPGPSDWDKLGESKAAHGTCESGNPKKGSRTHSAPFPPLLSCSCGQSKMGIAWKQRGCQ